MNNMWENQTTRHFKMKDTLKNESLRRIAQSERSGRPCAFAAA